MVNRSSKVLAQSMRTSKVYSCISCKHVWASARTNKICSLSMNENLTGLEWHDGE